MITVITIYGLIAAVVLIYNVCCVVQNYHNEGIALSDIPMAILLPIIWPIELFMNFYMNRDNNSQGLYY